MKLTQTLNDGGNIGSKHRKCIITFLISLNTYLHKLCIDKQEEFTDAQWKIKNNKLYYKMCTLFSLAVSLYFKHRNAWTPNLHHSKPLFHIESSNKHYVIHAVW